MAEEERHGTQVGVARSVQISDQLVLLRRPSGIMHITQMILALDVVLVIADQLIFVRQLEKDSEEAQKSLNNFFVAFLGSL